MIDRRLTLLPVLASLTLAACGGEDGPTRQEFAEAADRVCTDIQRQGNALQSPQNVAEIQEFVDQAKRTVDDGVRRLREIEKPSGDAGETAQQFVDAVAREAGEEFKPALDQLGQAAQRGDAEAVQEAGKRIEGIDSSESDRLARELGADACAE